MKRLLAVTSLAILLVAQSDVCSAQWTRVGLQGGPVREFITVGSQVYAADSGNGVFRSDDSGSSWSQINTGLASLDVVTIGSLGKSIFAATDTAGLFRSNDDGAHWANLKSWLPFRLVKTIASVYTTLVVGTDSGVFRSTDSGLSWTTINNGLTSINILQLVTSGNNLFALTKGASVFRSSDNGSTWINASQGLSSDPVEVLFSSDTLLLAVNRNGVFRSTNYGRNWTNPYAAETFQYGVWALAMSDSGILVGTQNGRFGGLSRTPDNGSHWTWPSNGSSDILHSIVYALVVIGQDVLAATDYGVSRSTDYGVTWPQNYYDLRPFGPGPSQTTLCVDALGPYLFAGTQAAGLLRSNDGGANWIAGKGLTINTIHTFVQMGNLVFVGTDTGGVYRSTDSGSSWAVLEGITNSYSVSSLVVDGTVLFAGTVGGGVFRSIDSGNTWLSVDQGITSLHVSALFLKDSELLVSTGKGILGSLDHGSNWILKNSALSYDSSSFVANKTCIFSGSPSGGVFRSTDGGGTWMNPDTSTQQYGASPIHVYTFAINDSILFAAGGGVYYSTNNGGSWIQADSGITSASQVYSLRIIGSYLYAGTGDDYNHIFGGVWRRPLSDFLAGPPASVQALIASPPQIQSYPNPFTQSTTITFSSQDEGYAEVTVVNLLGSQVARIFSGELSSGEHSFTWDASGMAPGMYECVVRSNGQVQRISMMLSEP